MEEENRLTGIPILIGMEILIGKLIIQPNPQPIMQFKACGPDAVRYGEWKEWLKKKWKPRRRKRKD